MKKMFTLVIALIVMTFCANAQYLLQESFDSSTLPTGWSVVDSDGDGNNWTMTASTGLLFSIHSGAGCIISESYSNTTQQALTPDNWLISPAVNLTGNSELTYWVAAQDENYSAENYSVYISTTGSNITDFTTVLYTGVPTGTYTQQTINLSAYTGQTVYIAFRHHNVTDMFVLNIDDVAIFATPTNPTIVPAISTVDFGTQIVSTSSTQTVDITAYNLTSSITATATAPFEISADGTTFGATATIPQNGGTLHIKYTATTAGPATGSVTLSSTSATDVTIALSGTGLDCSNNPLPYTFNFDNEAQAQCWTIVDVNNDGNGSYGEILFNFAQGNAYYAYLSTSAANDWLISPVFNIPATGAAASFDYSVSSSAYPEKYSVYVIPSGNTYADATNTLVVPTQTVTNITQSTQYVDLTAFAGQSVQIGIKVESDPDMYGIYFSNFFIGSEIPSSLAATPNQINFGSVPAGDTYNTYSIIETVNVNEAISISTAAPFSISLDGTTFATTATIPANTSLSTADTLYIQFDPTTADTYNGTISINTTTLGDSILLSGTAVDCSGGITEFPFTHTFNDRIIPPTCWGYNDASNFLTLIIDSTISDYGLAMGDLDHLITPEIHTSAPLSLTFDAATYGGSSSSTTFRIGYSTTDNNISSFTWTNTITITTDDFASYTSQLPAGTKYVAFEATEIGVFMMGFYTNYLFLDNITLTEVTDAQIYANDITEIDFGNVHINTTSNRELPVMGILTTENITATTTAPFEVSADNATFGTTASLPATGGTLYVRYAPTAVGTHSATLTLASTGATSLNINLEGIAFECSQNATLPYTQDFEGAFPPNCWTIVSFNEITWEASTNIDNGSTTAFCTYSTTLQDEKLITEGFDFTGNTNIVMTFDFVASYTYVTNPDVNEQYDLRIYTSIDGGETFSTTPIFSLRDNQGVFTDWVETQATIDLSSLAGQSDVKLMFNYYGTYGADLSIDNINISAGTGIEENAENISVYPNPANDMVNVEASSLISNIEIFSISGQKIGEYAANGNNASINISSLSNGLYLMKINTENGVINEKFSVIR